VTPRLEVRGACVAFEGSPALRDVRLQVAPGEVVSVLGPSGSGKSTLLRAIAGLQPLDAGTILLDGEPVDDRPPHRRDVGLMFQDQALFPHLDVGANVAFGLRMQGQRPQEARPRVRELLELVGLAGFGERAVATLSGGEQQRVALARALAPGPRLLLLDEPLGALDRPLRERLVGELQGLFTELGLTVVAVTHDQAEAFALGDRLAVMAAGTIVQVGPPAEVWARPASAEVAGLLGLTNVVPVRVEAGRLQSPWGDLGPAPTASPVASDALVRPDGFSLAPDGPVVGTVAGTTFAGARTRLTVAVAGAPILVADVAGADHLGPGSPVRLRIDPSAVVLLGP
jgi:thiamine transport system ATP-binding protein